MSTYVVGITGASGVIYAKRLLEVLLSMGNYVKLVISPTGEKILSLELGFNPTGSIQEKAEQWRKFLNCPGIYLELLEHKDLSNPIASSSFPVDGMVVIPCSMGSLARIASGISSNLIERAADVALKEKRKLILVPRETPLSLIHLKNMVRAAEAGAEIMPAMPPFYHNPSTISDLVDMFIGKVLERLGIQNDLTRRWGVFTKLKAEEL